MDMCKRNPQQLSLTTQMSYYLFMDSTNCSGFRKYCSGFREFVYLWRDFNTYCVLCICSDFRYESNGIFVLGVGFFSSDKFRLFN